MAYLSNPVYTGVGAVDTADGVSAIVRSAQFDRTFAQALTALRSMSPADVQRVAAYAQQTLQRLPVSKQASVVKAANLAAQTLDYRAVPGLGNPAAAAAGAVDITAKIANIAGVIASMATVGLSIATFIDSKKQSKEQAAAQGRQEQMARDQMNADIAAKKEQLAMTKAAADAAQKRSDLESSGMMIDAEGNVIKKPTNPLATVGGVAAAAAAAFFLSK